MRLILRRVTNHTRRQSMFPEMRHAKLFAMSCALCSMQGLSRIAFADFSMWHDGAVKIRMLAAAVLLSLAGCSAQPPPAADPLIVIVADRPFTSREDFAADIQSQHDGPVSEESVDLHYEELLRDVAAVQAEQIAILSNLTQEHDLKGVYLEGMTDENADDFRTRVQQLSQVDIGRQQRRSGKSENPEVIARADELLRSYEYELLRIGAVGRLLMSSLLDEVLPLEDAATPAKQRWCSG